MKKSTIRVLCALGTVAAAPAFASDADVGRVYMTPQIGYLRADSERPTDRDNVLGGFALRQTFQPGLVWRAAAEWHGARWGESRRSRSFHVCALGGSAARVQPLGILFSLHRHRWRPDRKRSVARRCRTGRDGAGEPRRVLDLVGRRRQQLRAAPGSESTLGRRAHSAGRLLDYIATLGIPVLVGWPAESTSGAATTTDSTTATSSATPAATTSAAG